MEEFPVGTRVQIMPNRFGIDEFEKGRVCTCMRDTVVVDTGHHQINCNRSYLRKIYEDGINKNSIVRVRQFLDSRFSSRIGLIKELYGSSAYVDFGDVCASIDRDNLEVIGTKN